LLAASAADPGERSGKSDSSVINVNVT
jgi:hypothetical protein